MKMAGKKPYALIHEWKRLEREWMKSGNQFWLWSNLRGRILKTTSGIATFAAILFKLNDISEQRRATGYQVALWDSMPPIIIALIIHRLSIGKLVFTRNVVETNWNKYM
jgi:hypothetical protein